MQMKTEQYRGGKNMEFYDKVKQTAEVAGEKIGQFTDITKVRLEIAEAKRGIKKLYEELGKSLYNGKSDAELTALCEQLDAKNQELLLLQNRLNSLLGKKECDNCGKNNEKGAKYCANCGYEL